MKRFLLIAMLSLTMVSCGVYHQATYVSNQIYVGMTIQEFKKVAGNYAKLDSMKNGYTIYKIYDYDVWSGQPTDVRFYYFYEGKLVQMDGGVKQADRYEYNIYNH